VLKIHQNPEIQLLKDPFLKNYGISLSVKREDQIHPLISGNKWRKLKYNLIEAQNKGHDTILSFGGAYSNHLFSVAAAANETGFKSIGIIRGEEIQPLNPTLTFANHQGMKLHFISRSLYRKKNSDRFLKELRNKFGNFYLIPEGGSNALAVKGCVEMAEEINYDCELICCPVATGGTLAGLVAGLKGRRKLLGFSVLKGKNLNQEVISLIEDYGVENFNNWSIDYNYHFGGYAKFKPELINFINDFRQRNNIALDPIYTGKMFYGIYAMIKEMLFKPGTRILIIHTGGLQGIAGFNQRFGDLIK